MEKYLNEFWNELIKLIGDYDNVVIAGSNVLQAHGLKLNWTPEDLDIVVFLPTDNQLSEVVDNDKYEVCLSYEEAERREMNKDDFIPRSYKMSRKGLTLNIILERDKPRPSSLLYIAHRERYFPVNSIANIISAKVSYASGDVKQFMRAKDMQHLISLKNNNFNL